MEVVNNSASYSVEQDSHEPVPNQVNSAVFNTSEVAEYFCHRFLQDAASDEMIAQFLHPQGAACPYCTIKIESIRTLKSFYSLKRCACSHCGKFFKATTKTIMQGAHNPRAVFLVAVFSKIGADTSQLNKLLNMHTDSIKLWQKKFGIYES